MTRVITGRLGQLSIIGMAAISHMSWNEGKLGSLCCVVAVHIYNVVVVVVVFVFVSS